MRWRHSRDNKTLGMVRSSFRLHHSLKDFWSGFEKLGYSSIALGNVKWHSHSGKQVGQFLKKLILATSSWAEQESRQAGQDPSASYIFSFPLLKENNGTVSVENLEAAVQEEFVYDVTSVSC